MSLLQIIVLLVVACLFFLGLDWLRTWNIKRKAQLLEFPTEWLEVLKRNVPIYRRLPDYLKMQLQHRIRVFITEKEFEACGGLEEVTEEMQVTIAAHAARHTFLESCVRAYLNGAAEPLLLSSGLEDYFLGTYFFNRGMYHTDVAGLTHLNKEDHSFSAYRFHEEDPIFFRTGLRLTLKCGEEIGGQRHNERVQRWKAPPTTYTTYVWIYEW